MWYYMTVYCSLFGNSCCWSQILELIRVQWLCSETFQQGRCWKALNYEHVSPGWRFRSPSLLICGVGNILISVSVEMIDWFVIRQNNIDNQLIEIHQEEKKSNIQWIQNLQCEDSLLSVLNHCKWNQDSTLTFWGTFICPDRKVTSR